MLRYLVERGRLTRLPNGLILAASALEQFQGDLLATGWDTFTVTEFKGPLRPHPGNGRSRCWSTWTASG